jgi:hypothetical protein
MEDGWDYYPWVDRTTALAAMTAWPAAGGHTLELLEGLQSRATLTIPDRGSWQVPDGIAELIVSALTPKTTLPPAVGAQATGIGTTGSYWGCAVNGPMRAVLGAAPNDAPHAHRDVGNVVVRHGSQEVLADLGQRDYNLTGVSYVWRELTKAHNTIGILQSDGRVVQLARGSGTVTTAGDGLQMMSGNALNGTDWKRGVVLTDTTVSVRDELTLRAGVTAKPMSMSFLLAAPPSRVAASADGRLRFTLDDGSTWELVPPAGTAAAFRDANPTTPYDDTTEFKTTIGPAHTLVTVQFTLTGTLDLTTSLVRVT